MLNSVRCSHCYGKSEPDVGRLNFGLVLWMLGVFCLVFLCAASASIPVLMLFAIIWAIALFVVPFFLGSIFHGLIAAILFLFVFNATYLPLFGLFSAVNNEPAGIYRLALGLRSGWFAAALLLVGFFVLFKRNAVLHRASIRASLIFILFLFFGVLISGAPLDSRATYLLNSFVPLAMFFFFVSIASTNKVLDIDDVWVLNRVVLIVALFGAVYFVLLPLLYDFFRPDLASFLRARAGEYIPRGGYDPSWGTRIGDFYFNRYVGSFPDPIVAGYFLGAMAFSLFVVGFNFLSGIFFVLLLFSLSKGAWLFFGQAIVLYFISRKWHRAFFSCAVLFMVVQLSLSAFLDASNKIHYLGLVGGVKSVFEGGIRPLLFGYGIGDGGNLARGYIEGGALGAAWLGSGSESGVGVLVHQLGFFGLFLFLVVVKTTYDVNSVENKNTSNILNNDGRWAVRSLLCSAVINMPLQENCINASVLSSILLGIVVVTVLKYKDD